jgi:cytochrome c
MKKLVPAVLSALVLLSSIGYANAADVKKGARVFNKCKACHTLAAGKNRIGPSLHGIFGRTAGTAPGYNYSKAMSKAGAEGLVWTEKTLKAYLKKPRDYVKGTKMTFVGLKKESDRENLIAFLKEASK